MALRGRRRGGSWITLTDKRPCAQARHTAQFALAPADLLDLAGAHVEEVGGD